MSCTSAHLTSAPSPEPRLSGNELGGSVAEELSILERVAAGDQRAVAECLDHYGNLVWSLARRFLGNSPEAEDAVQDIFIEIWSCAHRYNKESGSEAT
ncbi:MAG: RNA polymerase sigma factor, partial [Gammaproteobacteria bacterium]